jgi:hypothetical protein
MDVYELSPLSLATVPSLDTLIYSSLALHTDSPMLDPILRHLEICSTYGWNSRDMTLAEITSLLSWTTLLATLELDQCLSVDDTSSYRIINLPFTLNRLHIFDSPLAILRFFSSL